MANVFSFLSQLEVLQLQVLSKFYYDVQMPRYTGFTEIKVPKTRLHLLNHDYIILFNMQ